MAMRYVDKSDVYISHADWKKHRADESYSVIRRYSNGKIFAEVVWDGRVINADSTPREFWEHYKVKFYNIVEFAGVEKKVVDPSLTNRWGSEKRAIQDWEDKLQNHTECEWDEYREELVTEGDISEPIVSNEPVVISADQPHSVEEADAPKSDFGSW